MIDAIERRTVATVDIPGVFMHSNLVGETTYMIIENEMAEILVNIAPSIYKKIFTCHVKLKKALYGTLRAALLFWRNFTELLKSWKFIINPYNACVANKIIDGTQCKIIWHVDDVKISHAKASVVKK